MPANKVNPSNEELEKGSVAAQPPSPSKAQLNSHDTLRETEYKVYPRRWHVLWAYGLSYFGWNWACSRYVVIASTAARYHDTTNQVDVLGSGELGIDFLTIASNLGVIISYLPAAYFIDRYGLKWTSFVGNVCVCLGIGWTWYFSGRNWTPVVLSSFIGCIMGTFQTTTLLSLTNRWFPQSERSKAVALASFVGMCGFAASVMAAGFFATGEDTAVDFCMKSCMMVPDEYFRLGNATLDGNQEDACLPNIEDTQTLTDPWDWRRDNCGAPNIDNIYNSTGLECTESARANFCCYTPTNIDSYGFFLAVLLTCTTIYNFIVTEDYPPTPPSPVGEKKAGESFLVTTKHCFSKRNFWQTILAEFVIAGPSLVAYATVDRILPSSIYFLKGWLGMFAFFLSAPLSYYVGRVLDKTKKFYEVTSVCHGSGLFFMAVMWLGYEIGGLVGGVMVFFSLGTVSSLTVAWQTAEYEVKMEYVYTEKFNVEGTVVGYDRFMFNICSVVMLPVLAPENFPCPSSLNAFRCFLVLTIIGFLIYQCVPDKRNYLRLAYEESRSGGSNSHRSGGGGGGGGGGRRGKGEKGEKVEVTEVEESKE